MLVTLPFVLLLLDYWPLGRLRIDKVELNTKRLILEKLPFFGLAAGSSVITVLAQRASQLKRILPGCTERFRGLAEQCMGLIETVGKEFRDQRYESELATLVGNLQRLAESNAELHHRWKAFGTSDQKAAMERHLDAQEGSLATMQASLKELAGNLALIEAAADQETASTEGLRDINRGLEELMKEWSHGN